MHAPSPLVLSALSTLLTLGLLEAGARIWADPTDGQADVLAMTNDARTSSIVMKSPDPELIYVTRPNYMRDKTRMSEAHGVLRSTDVTVEKPAGTFRVAVLGDSIAAGHPLRGTATEPFPLQVEHDLNTRAGTKAEVLTFAADGYSTLQEARLLELEVGRFSPDVVVVAYCVNDPTNSYTPTVWFLDDPAPRSYLADFAKRRLGLTPSELSPAHPRYTWGAINWPELYRIDGPLWRGAEQGLSRIAAWGRERHTPVELVLFPLLLKGDEPKPEQEQAEHIYAQVRTAAERLGLRFLDLREAYRGHQASELRFLPEDPIHPGALGHTLAAHAIEARLEADGLVSVGTDNAH